MPSDADGQLLQRARAGDRSALEQLIERHEQQVYRFGLKMCRDPQDAQDVLQDTLLTLARSVRDFRGASSISTWLYTVARSHCIKKRRRSKFAPDRESSLETEAAGAAAGLSDDSQSPDDILAGKEVERALEQALGEMEPMYREVLLLRDGEGLTAPEVAEVVGISVQAVKSRLHRARLALREKLAPVLGIAQPEAPAPSTCPDVLSLFSQYLDGEINAVDCAAMERHLEGCARCAATCSSLKRTLAICRSAELSTAVPAKVQASVRVALRNLLSEVG